MRSTIGVVRRRRTAQGLAAGMSCVGECLGPLVRSDAAARLESAATHVIPAQRPERDQRSGRRQEQQHRQN